MQKNEFMIKSETLDKLKVQMQNAAQRITDAMKQKQPIWIRHHADTDGYCGAVALERVILKNLHEIHRRERDVFNYYRRLPSRTPFYDYSDALKDLTNMFNEVARFEQKKPLIIVVDNGSSFEDLLSLKTLSAYGVDLIVIDHHPAFSENDNYISIHINPWLVDGDSGVVCGMLCAELARMIDSSKEEEMGLLAALSGAGDKSQNTEMKQYADIAGQKGCNIEELSSISDALNYISSNIGYMESRQMIDDLLFGDREKQKQIVGIITKELNIRKQELLFAIKKYIEKKEHNGVIIAKLNTGTIISHGQYPSGAKAISIAKEYLENEFKKNVVAMGYGDSFITFRISHPLLLDMNKIKEQLAADLPHALVQGGGHAHAGTIKFCSAAKEEVMDLTEKIIKQTI